MVNLRRLGGLLLMASLAAALLACAGTSSSAPRTAAPSAAASAASTAPRRPDHTVIVVLENKEQGQVMTEAPFLASLAETGASLTDMRAETHPSQPNYLALFSGDTHAVTDDSCPHTFAGPSLGGALLHAGLTFAAYSEDLPDAGYSGCSRNEYVRKHAPWADFTDVPGQLHEPLSAMPSDPAQLPTVSFVIPNLCHDMHDCSIAEGDAWLRDRLGGYVTWARTHESLLLVTFDESEAQGDPDNHIATIAVGQRVAQGPIATPADHYSLLRTLEDLYGLPALGHTAEAAPLSGLWQRS
jgi:hypothetical protein